MKGSRELNNMKDTPSFKIKKVLAISKLRHSNSSGRKAVGSSSTSKTAKKHTNVKTKTVLGGKRVSSQPAVVKRKGRPPRPKTKEEEDTVTTGPKGDIKKGEQKVTAIKDEIQSEKKLSKDESVTDQFSSSLGRKKFVKKHSKAQLGSKTERNLRSQIGEMLMRHGKKVPKAPKPKRKRTLSADFELLDERSLKKTLKETAETASGTETDQNDSDASSTVHSLSESNMAKSVKKRNTTLKTRGKETLDSSWVDCPSPLVDSARKISKKSKNATNSRDSSLDESETGVVLKRQGAKQRTIVKRLTDTKRSLEDKVEVTETGEERDTDKSLKDEEDDARPRKRGRPPKRKRLHLEKECTEDDTKSVEQIDAQKQTVLTKSGTKETSKDGTQMNISDGKASGKKQRLNIDENPQDPYTFSGMDFGEEDVDNEVTFKPTGISGEVKRKPGRPKHGASRQPAVKALKVKSTHKLLISDQKQRPFSRVRGGRILKASQIYRGSGHKRRLQPLQTKAPVTSECEKTLVDGTDMPAEDPTMFEKKNLPVIAPLNIVIAEQDLGVESPLSPDIQHPDLTIIKDLISPAPSNEDLEPPVLELANIDPCDLHIKENHESISAEEDIGPAELDNEQRLHPDAGLEIPVAVDDTDVTENKVEGVPEELGKVQESDVADSEEKSGTENIEDFAHTVSEDNNIQISESNELQKISENTNEINEEKCDTGAFSGSQVVEACSDLVESDNAAKIETDVEPVTKSEEEDSVTNFKQSNIDVNAGISVVKEPESDVKDSNVKDLDSEGKELDSVVKESEPDGVSLDSKVSAVEESIKESEFEVEEVVEKVVENTIRTLLDTVDDMLHSLSNQTDEKATEDKTDDVLLSGEQMDGICDSDIKEKDQKYELGGIKMKLKRHKGKFKVTRLSEEDECLLGDFEGHPDIDMDDNSNLKVESLTEEDDVTLVMNSILDEIDCMFDTSMTEDDKSPNENFDLCSKSNDNEVFVESADAESANFSSSSDVSPTDSEKRVPPLTIRLKSGKAGKKPVRKFELRPKFSRSPIEIIAMRQKRYEEEYDKNEATRLAKKLEKQICKRKNLMKTSFKDVNIAETGLSNADKAGNIGDLLDLCTPCSVPVVDFVKQLNLQPDEEEGQKTSAEEAEAVADTKTESQSALGTDSQRKGMKPGRKSQFKSGRPRGRPPKLKNKLTVATTGSTLKLKPDEPSPMEVSPVEKDVVEDLREEGFVGSFVEFLKSKKKDKAKTAKPSDGPKGTKKMDAKGEHTKPVPTLVVPPTTATIATSVTSPTETVKTKHLSGDRKSGVRYVCNKCEFSSVVQKTMVFHVYSHIPGVSFKCGYCNKDFLSMAGASAHSKNEHPGKESRIIKSKDLNESELYHVVDETPKVDTALLKPLEAGQVGRAPGQVIISFLVGSNLALKASTKRFVCTHCEYSTDILEDVQQHCKDLHTTDNMFACILCADAYFSSEETVKNHNHSTHPTRPQSYRKLPSYYDIEQMKAAEKSQLEDRGNIFDRMNNLFSTSNIAEDTNSDNPRKAHYQRARDFLYVQEGWRNKTSAEADSTTILENESVGTAEGQAAVVEKESLATTEDSITVMVKESDGKTDHNRTVLEKKSLSDSVDTKPASVDNGHSSVDCEKPQDKPSPVAHPTKDKDQKAVEIPAEKAEPKGAVSESPKTSVEVVKQSALPASIMIPVADAEPVADAGVNTERDAVKDTTATGIMGKEEMVSQQPAASTKESEVVAENKSDDSGVSNLKIIEVVSLRDQNREPSPEAAKKKVLPRTICHSSRGSSNLPEVDVDALVLRNERITCTYKCMKCNIHSPYLSAMVEHLKHYHSEVTLFTCPYCRGFNSQKPEFTTEVNVHEHVKKAHPSNCAKNEVSLSDTAKTFVQVLAIPSGVECNKVGNTFVIEKDIYMCLKCQAHMPSLDYTFGHLEREHPDAFVQVCPLCKTFKDKSDEVVFGHIMKEHKQDPNDHPLSVAIEDNLFVRIPSISKSGAYNDRVNPTKIVKGDSHRKILPKSSVRLGRNDDSEDDVLVVGETRNFSRPSAIRTAGTLAKRGRPALISQGSGSITTATKAPQKSPIRIPVLDRSAILQQMQARPLLGVTAKITPPKPKVSNLIKSSSDQSQQLMMDCESVDDPVNTLTDVVEDDGDVELPVVTATTSSNSVGIGSIIDSSNVISHSAAMAVASSVVSVATTVQTTTTVPSIRQSSTTTTAVNKQAENAPSQPPPLKKYGVSSIIASKQDVTQTATVVTVAKPQDTSSIIQQTSVLLPEKPVVSEKAKEIQISRPKSSLFSMTDKLHRLHARAAEREREKERAAQQERNSPSNSRGSPQTRDSPFGARSSPITSRSSPMSNVNQPVMVVSRPVLRVPSYSSIPRAPQRQVNSTPPVVTQVNISVQPNQSLAAQVQRKSLLFRNCPLDLSRTPSPATTPVSSNSQLNTTNVVIPAQSKPVTDELPPDAFKIFNLKPDPRRQKSAPPTPSSTPAASPVTQILGNTIPNIVGTLAAPGTLLQQVQALPYTQLAQMQMAGVPLNPLQLQGLCIPGPNNSFVLANFPQQPGVRPNIPQQIPQMHVRPGSTTSVTTAIPVSQASRISSAKTVAQALAERSQTGRPVPQPRAVSKQHIPQSLLPLNKTNASRMAQQEYYCPYCSQFRPLREYEVKPHIERCHFGKEVLFFKLT